MAKDTLCFVSFEEDQMLSRQIYLLYSYLYQKLIQEKSESEFFQFKIRTFRNNHICIEHWLKDQEKPHLVINVPFGYGYEITLEFVTTEIQALFDLVLPGVVKLHYKDDICNRKEAFSININEEARPWSFARQLLSIEQIVDKIVDFLPKSIVAYRRVESFKFVIWAQTKNQNPKLATDEMTTIFMLQLVHKESNAAEIQTQLKDLPDIFRLIEYLLLRRDTAIPFHKLNIVPSYFHDEIKNKMGLEVTISCKN